MKKPTIASKTIFYHVLFGLFCAVANLGCGAARSNPYFQNWQKTYENRLDEGSKMLLAGPIWLVEKTRDGKTIYKEFFFETGQLTKREEILDEKSGIKNGLSTTWDNDGHKLEEGRFEQGVAIGTWRLFDEKTGRVSQLGQKIGPKKVGTWRYFHSDGWCSSTAEHNEEGQLHGETIIYDEKGQIVRRDFYEKGKFARSDDPSAAPDQLDLRVEQMPEYPGGEEALLTHFARTVRYPRDAREIGIKGRALVAFDVEKDGSISNLRVVNGLSKSIRDECLRVAASLQKWEPGSQNGQAVRVKMQIPIVFKLD